MKRTLLPALRLAVAVPALGLAAALLGTSTGGALSGHDTAASLTAASQAGKVGKVGKGASTSIVLHITNNTNQTLHYDGLTTSSSNIGQIAPPPDPTIAPGGTSTIFYTSSNIFGGDLEPIYRIGDTEENITAVFVVPYVAANGAACDDIGGSGPVTAVAKCDIDHGYHPNAHLTFYNYNKQVGRGHGPGHGHV
jgi:hypothetical protein